MKKGFKINNNGMTLIELIVAIGIFVAAIVPMLYAFVYSTGYNFKSQKAMQSTGIAQAVMENCKSVSFDYEDLKAYLDDASDGSTVFDGSIFTVNGNSTGAKEGINSGMYWIYGVRATNNTTDGTTSRRAYDVAIKPEVIDDSYTDYSYIQSMGHNTYNFGDTLSTALRNEDNVAQYAALHELESLFVDSNITCTPALAAPLPAGTLSAFFSTSDINVTKLVLDREIRIVIGDPNTLPNAANSSVLDQSVKVYVDYYLGYDAGSDGVADTPNFRIEHTQNIAGVNRSLVINTSLATDHTYATHADPVYSVDMGSYVGFNEAATALYFYYYPGYKSHDPDMCNYRDHIVIDNNMTVYGKDRDGNNVERFDVYLFKQYQSGISSYSSLEEDYDCDVTLNSTGHKTYLYHNLFWKVVEDVTHTPHIFKLVKLVSPGITVSAGTNCHNMTFDDPNYSNYANSYKQFTSSAANSDGYSHVLSHYAMLPYRHTLFDEDTSGYKRLFPARYRITVYVYSADNHSADGLIETMTIEMLNW